MSLAARKIAPARPTLLSALRDARWLEGERARGYGLIFAGLSLLAAAVWTVLSLLHGGLDPMGKPLGADFPSFFAASRLALDHNPALAYDPPTHWAVQRAVFSGAPVGYSAFFYPPPYLILCLPLALTPYAPALAAFLAGTGAAGAVSLRPLAPDRTAWLALIAYPAVLTNLAHGQNAFLTTALIAYGLLAMERRPITAGLVLGLMVIKPHLALVLPVALACSGRWKTFIATGLSAAALCLASLALFGAETWNAFFASSRLARAALEHGLVGDEKMQSVFAAARLAGAPLDVAWIAQAAVSLAVLGGLALGLRRVKDGAAQAALTVCAALLASPFLLDYDLMLAAAPMLWLLQQGRARGFLPWEKLGLAAAFVLPLASRLAGANLHLGLAPVVLAGLTALVLRRALGPADQLR